MCVDRFRLTDVASLEIILLLQLLQFQLLFYLFSLIIDGEVFVRPMSVATSASVITWHMAIIFRSQYFLVCKQSIPSEGNTLDKRPSGLVGKTYALM